MDQVLLSLADGSLSVIQCGQGLQDSFNGEINTPLESLYNRGLGSPEGGWASRFISLCRFLLKSVNPVCHCRKTQSQDSCPRLGCLQSITVFSYVLFFRHLPSWRYGGNFTSRYEGTTHTMTVLVSIPQHVSRACKSKRVPFS